MAQHNFEGDFASFSERQLDFINKVILEQDLKVKKVIFTPVGKPGDNFIGSVKRINIEGENGSLNMIVKVAASTEMARKMTNAEITFYNEHIMYTEVLPKMLQLQKTAGVPEEDQLRYAKCYGSLFEPPNETLILEDLNDADFTMLNKFESLSNECVRSVLKNFALLHSLSHVLRNQQPETYNQIKDKLTEVWTNVFSKEKFSNHAKIVEAEVISVLEDDIHKCLIENKLRDFVDWLPKILEQEDHKYSVIQQGDAWTNNFMFKVGDGSVKTIMIDYQASSNGNPAVDLHFMLLNCTDHETRSKNFPDWIDFYYSEFDKSLSNFGLKANFVYSRDRLDADIKKYAKVMFYLCVTFNTFLMRDSKEAGEFADTMKNVSLDESAEMIKGQQLQSETRVRIRNRVVGMIDSFKQFGLL